MTKEDDNDRHCAFRSSVCVLLPKLADGLGHSKVAGILSDKLESHLGLGHYLYRLGRGVA